MIVIFSKPARPSLALSALHSADTRILFHQYPQIATPPAILSLTATNDVNSAHEAKRLGDLQCHNHHLHSTFFEAAPSINLPNFPAFTPSPRKQGCPTQGPDVNCLARRPLPALTPWHNPLSKPSGAPTSISQLLSTLLGPDSPHVPPCPCSRLLRRAFLL